MICSRTKIYQKVFVGTHFLILIFDFKLKGLSKMTDRFCEGKKFHHQQHSSSRHHYHYWYLICWSNKTENPFNQKRRRGSGIFALLVFSVIGFLFCTYRIGGWYFWPIPIPNAMFGCVFFFCFEMPSYSHLWFEKGFTHSLIIYNQTINTNILLSIINIIQVGLIIAVWYVEITITPPRLAKKGDPLMNSSPYPIKNDQRPFNWQDL